MFWLVDTNNVMSDLNDSYSSSLNEPEVIPEMNRARYQRYQTKYQTEPLSSQNARVTSEIHNRHRRYQSNLFTQDQTRFQPGVIDVESMRTQDQLYPLPTMEGQRSYIVGIRTYPELHDPHYLAQAERTHDQGIHGRAQPNRWCAWHTWIKIQNAYSEISRLQSTN
jgi:hypothetical protein